MIKKGCISLALLVQCSLASAQGPAPNDWYVGFDANYIISEVGNEDIGEASFNPLGASLRIGKYLEPQVGIELYGMAGLSDHDDLNINLDVTYSLGIMGRFESPESEGGKLYILLGYGITELDMDRSETGSPGKESFHGFNYGGGAEFRLGQGEKYYASLQAVRYYDEDDLSIVGVSFGFRYRF